jgi:hypothetical protein
MEIVAVIVGGLVAFLIESWIGMLIIGALHIELIHQLPALAYYQTMLVVLALNFIASPFKSTSSD